MNEGESHEIPNCKDFLAQIGPLDTLLGSLSYNDIDNVDGKTQQLRASARVFKKMKFDQSNSSLEKKEKKEEVKPEDIKQENKKPASPLWTSEEKKMFFEALNEYGKDFESIHMSICTRLRKKGVPDDLIKSKYQIRHFYYKTFHMLLNSLKFSEKVPKNAQELYTLINYGEIRRKIGSVSKKNWTKLNELIYNGSIALRIKGKTIRVKTPMCRALRKLNQLNEKYDDLKLPTRVLVELKPKDMVSFLKVQSMAQNPRIKVALPLQKRVSSLITCINTRWKSSEAVVYDTALIPTKAITPDCVPDQKVIEQSSVLLNPLLRLSPPPDVHIELPSIDISEYFTGQSICLTAFELRKGVRAKDEPKKEESEGSTMKSDKSPTKQNGDTNCKEAKSVTAVVDDAINTILSLQSQDSQKCDNKNSVNCNVKDITDEKAARIEEIKEGWTVNNSGYLTIGEIYLMFGADSKLFLEYSWDPLQTQSQQIEAIDTQENVLSNPLKKLLSLAKLQCDKTAVKCTCGHVCGSKSNNAHFKKPVANKVVKKEKVQVVHESTVDEKVEDTDANTSFAIETKVEVNETKINDVNEMKLNELNETKINEVNDTPQEQCFQDTSLHSMDNLFNGDTIQRLNLRCRSRGRSRYKQLVVERKLVTHKSEHKHQIVSLDIVSQENKPNKELANLGESQHLLQSSGVPSLLLSNNNDKSGEPYAEKNFSGILGQNASNSGMSIGITKILKEDENQWLSSDVTDFSLSSLLGHLDCPSKTNQSLASISNEEIQLLPDVDAQISTLFIESSVDYTAKFADLAARVADKK